MSGLDFRPDVQDELLRLLFDKHRINLLKIPRQDLNPGQIFLVPGAANGVPIAYGPMALARVVPGAVVPSATPGARLADVEGASSRSAETHAEAGICAKLLAMFWPGVSLPGISAKVEATGATTLYCRFSEATRDGIDITEIGPALSTRSTDLSFVKDGNSFRIFIITDVYRCSKIEMTWTDAKGNVVDSKVAMDELARLEAGRGSRSSSGGKVSVEGSALAFGVRLLELVRREDGPGLMLQLEHTRLDVLGGEERCDDGRRMADDADYRLLADPWAGELGVELLATPPS